MNEDNENKLNHDKEYIFFYKAFRYSGKIISESETHFIINDYKEGEIHLPKSETLIKKRKEVDQN